MEEVLQGKQEAISLGDKQRRSLTWRYGLPLIAKDDLPMSFVLKDQKCEPLRWFIGSLLG